MVQFSAVSSDRQPNDNHQSYKSPIARRGGRHTDNARDHIQKRDNAVSFLTMHEIKGPLPLVLEPVGTPHFEAWHETLSPQPYRYGCIWEAFPRVDQGFNWNRCIIYQNEQGFYCFAREKKEASEQLVTIRNSGHYLICWTMEQRLKSSFLGDVARTASLRLDADLTMDRHGRTVGGWEKHSVGLL
jgi:hypothetical protein